MKWQLITILLAIHSLSLSVEKDTVPIIKLTILVSNLNEDPLYLGCDSVELTLYENGIQVYQNDFWVQAKGEIVREVNYQFKVDRSYKVKLVNICNDKEIAFERFTTNGITTSTRFIRELYITEPCRPMSFPTLSFNEKESQLAPSQFNDLLTACNMMIDNPSIVVMITFTYNSQNLPSYILERNKNVLNYMTSNKISEDRIVLKNIKVDTSDILKSEIVEFQIIAYDYVGKRISPKK